MCENELNRPNTLNSHKTTAITTTPFRIDLIVPCIGINRLTSHSKTPTTIKTTTTFINGISLRPPCALQLIQISSSHHTHVPGPRPYKEGRITLGALPESFQGHRFHEFLFNARIRELERRRGSHVNSHTHWHCCSNRGDSGICGDKTNVTSRLHAGSSLMFQPERVFPFINDFHNWPRWAHHQRQRGYRQMIRIYGGATTGVGALSDWDSKGNAGKGRMRDYASTVPAQKHYYPSDFEGPFEARNLNEFTLEQVGESTKVTWSHAGFEPLRYESDERLCSTSDKSSWKTLRKWAGKPQSRRSAIASATILVCR